MRGDIISTAMACGVVRGAVGGAAWVVRTTQVGAKPVDALGSSTVLPELLCPHGQPHLIIQMHFSQTNSSIISNVKLLLEPLT